MVKEVRKWDRGQNKEPGRYDSLSFHSLMQLIMGVAFGAIITFLVTVLIDLDIMSVLLIFVPLMVAGYLAYCVHIFRESTKDTRNCTMRMESIIDRLNKNSLIVIEGIMNVTINNKHVRYSVQYELLNETKYVYNDFKLTFFSDGAFGGYGAFEIWRDGKKVTDLSMEDLDYTECIRTLKGSTNTDDAPPHECTFTMPVNLKPGASCLLEFIQDDCHAFDVAFEGKSDFISTMIRYPTRRYKIKVCVDPKCNKRYSVKKIDHHGDAPFEVKDYSGNKMIDYEAELEMISIPSMNDGILEWDLKDPIVGFDYYLYFSIDKSGNSSIFDPSFEESK